MTKNLWLGFYVNDELKTSYDIKNTFEGELDSTRELIAGENKVKPDEVKVCIGNYEDKKFHKLLSLDTCEVIASSDSGSRSNITLIQVLNGTYRNKGKGRTQIPETARYEMFELFRSFVASTARGKRRERISHASMNYVKHWGILGRLCIHPNGDVEYIAGQDYPSEMAVLRDAFDS